jgi:hypothetical protein
MISPHFTGLSLPSSPSTSPDSLVQLSPILRQAANPFNHPSHQVVRRDSSDGEATSPNLKSNSDSAKERDQDRRSRSQRRPAPLRRLSSHRQDLEIAIAKDHEVSPRLTGSYSTSYSLSLELSGSEADETEIRIGQAGSHDVTYYARDSRQL